MRRLLGHQSTAPLSVRKRAQTDKERCVHMRCTMLALLINEAAIDRKRVQIHSISKLQGRGRACAGVCDID